MSVEEKSEQVMANTDPDDSSKESPLQNAPLSAAHASSPNFEEISTIRELLLIATFALAQIVTQGCLAQTIATSNLISEQFGVEGKAGEQSWFTASFSLTVGTFILISGRLGDLYGYKTMFVIGWGWTALFTFITGFTAFGTSTVALDVMRALQGIGPAILMPNAQAMIGLYYPPHSKKQSMTFSILGAVAASGFTIGSLVNSSLALVWWPWGFWVGAVCLALVGVMAYFVVPDKIGKKSNGKFDYLGAFVGVSGLVLINFAWNQGPNVGWNKPYVYVLLIVGIGLMVAFYFIEESVEDPLVPPSALKGDSGFILGCVAAGWSCFGIWLFYSIRWSLEVDHDSPVMASVYFIPACIAGCCAAMMASFMLLRFPLAFAMVVAMLAFFTGTVLMGTRPVGQTYWAQKFVSLLIQPIGMDLSFPAACILLSHTLPPHQQGIAGSLVSTFVNYSISIGLGFAGTVEYYTTKNLAPGLETTVLGFRNAFHMGMGLAGLGVVLSLYFLFLQLRVRKADARSKLESEIASAKSEPIV